MWNLHTERDQINLTTATINLTTWTEFVNAEKNQCKYSIFAKCLELKKKKSYVEINSKQIKTEQWGFPADTFQCSEIDFMTNIKNSLYFFFFFFASIKTNFSCCGGHEHKKSCLNRNKHQALKSSELFSLWPSCHWPVSLPGITNLLNNLIIFWTQALTN